MKLKTKILLFLSIIYLSFSIVVWLYSNTISRSINEKWSEKFVKNQVYIDKHRTLQPIIREIELSKKLAKEPAILQMALHENNKVLREKGLETLEKYRSKFRDQSYFIAFVQSENYYFNDNLNQYKSKQPNYTLSKKNSKDQWFYDTIQQNDDYRVNVNVDTVLGTTKVWINCLLKDNGKTIGVLGTGLNLTEFLKDTIASNHDGIRTVLINEDLAIQLDQDAKLIDYASISKKLGEHQTLSLILKNQAYLDLLRKEIKILEKSENENLVKTLWMEIDGKEYIVGLAYLKEVDWFSVSIINASELMIVDNLSIFFILTFFFMIAIFIFMLIYNFFVLKPLNRLQSNIEQMEYGNYNKNFHISGSEEITKIANQFKKMAEVISNYNGELENKIKERTNELLEAQENLKVFNKDLQNQVDCAVKKQMEIHEALLLSEKEKIEKDKIITLQMQFASIGKVIGNIVHQWKVPLVRAGTQLTQMEALIHFKKSDSIEEIEKIIPKLRNDFIFMKNSIDEFYALYQNDSDITEFKPRKIIDDIWNMLNGKVIFCNATIDFNPLKEECTIRGYEHFFAHIVMIILDNFLDIALERKIKSPLIIITCKTKGNEFMISFEDNCQGIRLSPISTIFDFHTNSTKKDHPSKGLGLHITKILIKEKFNGSIRAENTLDGACFTLMFPN